MRWTHARGLREAAALIVITVVLTLVCLRWRRDDLSQLSDHVIVENAESTVNYWATRQAFENLSVCPLGLGYSSLLYPDRALFAYSTAPYGVALPRLPV